MKKSGWLVWLLMGATFALAAEGNEVGKVDENRFVGFPSYAARVEAGMYPGASFGVGYSALVNVTALAASVLPVLASTPRLWASSQAVVWDTGLLYGMIDPKSKDASDFGTFLGFGGQSFKLGGGLTLWEAESPSPFRWIISQTTSGNIETTTYYPISGPATQSFQVIGGLSFDRAGGVWQDKSTQYLKKFALGDGWKTFLEGGIRMMTAYDFRYLNQKDNETKDFKDWTSQEFKVGLSPDLSVIGGSYEMSTLEGFFGFRFGIGLYKRLDLPKGAEDDMMTGWYLPMWVTLGLGGTPFALTDPDRAWAE